MGGGGLARDSSIVLSVAMLLSLTGLHALCPLELEPPSVVVLYGGPVLVHCRALAPDVLGMGLEALYGGKSLSPTRNVTWHLESVKYWEPAPICFINIPLSIKWPEGQCTTAIPVTVYKFPDSVRLIDLVGDAAALQEGSVRMMRCAIEAVAPAHNISVTLYVGNRAVLKRDGFSGGAKPMDLQAVFSYKPRREDNGHNMSCRVTFDLGPSGPTQAFSSQQHPLTVLYPPTTKQQLGHTELDLGSSAVLTCSYEANPALQHRWDYYKTGNVEESEVDGGGSLLHIRNATEVNIGTYTCSAANDLYSTWSRVEVTVKGALSPCPVEMTPARLVMRYGDQASVNCGNSTEDASRNLLGVSWRVGQRATPGPRWDVDPDTDWDPRPACVANFSGLGECSKAFDLTFYKTPDMVRIRVDGRPRMGVAMLADIEHLLVCEVLNVAPVQNLTVRWFLGQTPIQNQGTVQVSGCSPARVDCLGTRSPVDVTSRLQVVLRRDQTGALFRCEAQLTLETIAPPPPTASHPLNITVHYKPVINRTGLPASVPVFRGYPEDLVCVADGRPAPTVFWCSEGGVHVSGGTLTVTEAGLYTCNASNAVGYTTLQVEVVLKEDYLPLIAGLVALTVVVISAIFLFFYSIYYKNAKMRHYSLRRPKLSARNGNVAHSSWVAPLPMINRS